MRKRTKLFAPASFNSTALQLINAVVDYVNTAGALQGYSIYGLKDYTESDAGITAVASQMADGVDLEDVQSGDYAIALKGGYLSLFVVTAIDTAQDGTKTLRLALVSKMAVSGSASVDLSAYQTKTDDTLKTTAKTIAAAINEVFADANGIDAVTATDIGFSASNPNAIALIHDGKELTGQTPLDLSAKYALKGETGGNGKKLYWHCVTIVLPADAGNGKTAYHVTQLEGASALATPCDSWTDIKTAWPHQFKLGTVYDIFPGDGDNPYSVYHSNNIIDIDRMSELNKPAAADTPTTLLPASDIPDLTKWQGGSLAANSTVKDVVSEL